MLILHPPNIMRSAPDVINDKTISGLKHAGIDCERSELWPEFWAKKIWFSALPGRRRLFEYGPAYFSLLGHHRKIKEANAVWINGPSSLLNTNCWFERSILKAGKPYIFHLQDDWFSVPGLEQQASARVQLATLVVVPSDVLKERILGLFPAAKVLVLEDPIDIDRVRPLSLSKNDGVPFFVWSGHPASLNDLQKFSGIFDAIFKKFPFKIRVICGETRPEMNVSFPWEWFPYDRHKEADLLSGAVAGLAPLADSPYNRCKATYKPKTYFAAGIPVVASPVGFHSKIIIPGYNGILPNNDAEWEVALSSLLNDKGLVSALGEGGRHAAVTKYSHEVLMPIWAEQFRSALPCLFND